MQLGTITRGRDGSTLAVLSPSWNHIGKDEMTDRLTLVKNKVELF